MHYISTYRFTNVVTRCLPPQHCWYSGSIGPCHGPDPSSILGQCMCFARLHLARWRLPYLPLRAAPSCTCQARPARAQGCALRRWAHEPKAPLTLSSLALRAPHTRPLHTDAACLALCAPTTTLITGCYCRTASPTAPATGPGAGSGRPRGSAESPRPHSAACPARAAHASAAH
jgi:hypothetical protein